MPLNKETKPNQQQNEWYLQLICRLFYFITDNFVNFLYGRKKIKMWQFNMKGGGAKSLKASWKPTKEREGKKKVLTTVLHFFRG